MSDDTREVIHSASDDGGNRESESSSEPEEPATFDHECSICGAEFQSRESRNEHFEDEHY